MKKRLSKSKLLLLLIISVLVAFSSCKKNGAKPSDDGDTTATSDRLSDEDSLKFYVWWINESDSENIPLYLWNDQVTAADPLSSQFSKGEDVMNYIRSFPQVNGKKVDRYSFLDRTGAVSGELEGGVSGDFGFMIAAALDTAGNYHLYVEYVYGASPAGRANIQRGDEIVSINNNADMNLDDNANLNRINQALFQSQSVALKLQKPDENDSYNADISVAQYHINPVLFDTVYTVNNEKVGYFVYNSFVSVGSDANGAQAQKEIDDAFNNFKDKGIKDLIVDLRYNGGGAVLSTEYLDNLIAPSAANGKTMYSYEYNTPLTQYFNSTTDLKSEFIDPVKFDLAALNLNLNRVFFIVGSGTASASELTINNLKPYMDVKLIGDTTYGKPVGFFTIPIEFVTDTAGYAHVADMYAINFKSVNSAGQSDYYSGMTPDVRLYDYVDLNWGDTRDPRLMSIFNYIEGKGFLTQSDFERKAVKQSRLSQRPAMFRKAPDVKITNPNEFNGMVDYRMKVDVRKLLKK